MKKMFVFPLIALPLLFACNNGSKDSVEKADSTNQANHDTAVNNNMAVIDEAGSSFLVKIADGGMAEVQIATMAQQKASTPSVKDFASMLVTAHTAVNQEAKSIATSKNVVLPDSISADKQKDVDELAKKKGKDFEKAFVNAMIKKHEDGIALFEKTSQDTKDP